MLDLKSTDEAMTTGRGTILDADGHALGDGMTVRVLGLAPGLLDGLDPEEVAYLATVPGTLAGSTRSSTATSA